MSSIPRPGDFLVADPRLTDPNFESTVVLICEHNEEGTLGLIINRPIECAVQLQFENQEWDGDLEVYWGGPVSQQGLHALHQSAPAQEFEETTEVLPGLYFGGVVDDLIEANDAGERIRFFFGYSGWEPGQLDGELAEGAWHVIAAKTDQIFSEQVPGLWSKLMVELDPSFAWMSRVPEDPSLN